MSGPRAFRGVVVTALAFGVSVCGAAASEAQTRFETKVFLGANNDLEVDAVYHDPVDIDRRLAGSRVIPMDLAVRNRSSRPVTVDYQDLILDLGGTTGLTRLLPVDPATARSTLMSEGITTSSSRLSAARPIGSRTSIRSRGSFGTG